MTSPQIFIVDDDPSVLEALSRLLAETGYPVHCYRSGEEFLGQASLNARGCLVLDVNMNGISGLAVQAALLERNSPLKVIMISGRADVPTAVKSVKLGALEFLEKPFHPAELSLLISRLMDDADIQQNGTNLLPEILPSRFSGLTDRELIILKGIVRGLSNRELAEVVGMSLRTIQFCRKSIFEKTGFKNRAELMNWIVMNSTDITRFRP